MTKRKLWTTGPQSLVTQAQYLLNDRRLKVWIPFLETKIAELQARIQARARQG